MNPPRDAAQNADPAGNRILQYISSLSREERKEAARQIAAGVRRHEAMRQSSNIINDGVAPVISKGHNIRE